VPNLLQIELVLSRRILPISHPPLADDLQLWYPAPPSPQGTLSRSSLKMQPLIGTLGLGDEIPAGLFLGQATGNPPPPQPRLVQPQARPAKGLRAFSHMGIRHRMNSIPLPTACPPWLRDQRAVQPRKDSPSSPHAETGDARRPGMEYKLGSTETRRFMFPISNHVRNQLHYFCFIRITPPRS
jgi:hypothetical protein